MIKKSLNASLTEAKDVNQKTSKWEKWRGIHDMTMGVARGVR